MIKDMVCQKAEFRAVGAILVVVNFFSSEEIFIEGREMIRRAMKLSNATLGLDYVNLVLGHSDRIPESWDEYDLVFAGAKLKTETGFYSHQCHEFIAYLRKVRGVWRLGYGGIDFDWDSRARLLRCRYD